MKNILKTNIRIPCNVKLFVKGSTLFLEGSQGFCCISISSLQSQNLIPVNKKANLSTFFRSLQKVLSGICLGFIVRLAFVGVGFRVESIKSGFLKLKLGYSHFVYIKIPVFVDVFTVKKTLLILKCTNEHLLKEFCARIRLSRLPDVYKGKGILYKNQNLTLKEGKKK
jgi:large subunit ribosomal protein L6